MVNAKLKLDSRLSSVTNPSKANIIVLNATHKLIDRLKYSL